jgi:hypothetical protein
MLPVEINSPKTDRPGTSAGAVFNWRCHVIGLPKRPLASQEPADDRDLARMVKGMGVEKRHGVER